MPLPLLHFQALWFQTFIIPRVTFTSDGIKQPNCLILFTVSPKNKLRLHQTSCWLVWTPTQHFVGCSQSTLSPWIVSSHRPLAQPFPASACLLKSWNFSAHFKDQLYCWRAAGGRWWKHCCAIWESLVLGKSFQPLAISYPVVLPLGEAWGWGSVAVSWRQNTMKDNFKPTWLSSTVPNARVCWFMTTSQSCLQTVWQPRQTQILNSVQCRPIPFHLQHLPCTRTRAQHKSAVLVPGQLFPGLLQLVRAVSGDRISTLILSIDLCLIYIPLIWFSSRHHEYKSKVTPTRVRSYTVFKLA